MLVQIVIEMLFNFAIFFLNLIKNSLIPFRAFPILSGIVILILLNLNFLFFSSYIIGLIHFCIIKYKFHFLKNLIVFLVVIIIIHEHWCLGEISKDKCTQ